MMEVCDVRTRPPNHNLLGLRRDMPPATFAVPVKTRPGQDGAAINVHIIMSAAAVTLESGKPVTKSPDTAHKWRIMKFLRFHVDFLEINHIFVSAIPSINLRLKRNDEQDKTI